MKQIPLQPLLGHEVEASSKQEDTVYGQDYTA